MESHYKTLKIIFDIVQDDPQPLTYLCKPRDIILRQFLDWSNIHEHLVALEAERLITTQQMETLAISITQAGIEKIKSFNREEIMNG